MIAVHSTYPLENKETVTSVQNIFENIFHHSTMVYEKKLLMKGCKIKLKMCAGPLLYSRLTKSYNFKNTSVSVKEKERFLAWKLKTIVPLFCVHQKIMLEGSEENVTKTKTLCSG